ncbi:Cof-type HAD-IIB family hydrolase [Streptomyces sp. Tue 6430]|nr:Cof-type HAD-IIB family hydrolase [Streptomyces sp. Tue 6430]
MSAPDRIRLVCTDLDGTLLNERGAIGPLTHGALTEAARGGVPVVCVTGRPLRDALSVCRDISTDGLVVCSNGAVVAEVATGKPLRCQGFSRRRARTVLARLRARLPGVVLGVDTLRGLFLERGFETLVPDCWQHACVPDAAEVPIPGDGVLKILAVHPDLPGPSLARALIHPGDGVLATCSTPYFLEVAPTGVDKGRPCTGWPTTTRYGPPLSPQSATCPTTCRCCARLASPLRSPTPTRPYAGVPT